MFFASPSNDLYEGHDSSFLPYRLLRCFMPHVLGIPHRYHSPTREMEKQEERQCPSPAFCVPQLPAPSPHVRAAPPVFSLWVFPFCRINSSKARSLGWKPPVASKTQEKNSSYGASVEPATSGGPRTCQGWSVALPTTMLLGTRLPWRDCSMPTDGCFWGGFLRKLRPRELKWISQGHTGSNGGKSIPAP